MKIIAVSTLRRFWDRHPDAEQPLKAWHDEARHANWKTPQDIKRHYASASFVGRNRVVFADLDLAAEVFGSGGASAVIDLTEPVDADDVATEGADAGLTG